MPPEAGDFTLEITLHALQGTETRSLAVGRPPAEEPAVPAPVMAPAAPHDAPLRLAVPAAARSGRRSPRQSRWS